MTQQQEPKITKCPPGYAWGYTPTGSNEIVDNIDNDFRNSLNTIRLQNVAYFKLKKFHNGQS